MAEDENKVLLYEVKDGKLNFEIDSNKDGEKVVGLSLNLNEAISEAIQKGQKVAGAKVADFEFSGSTLKLKLDTDQDSEPFLEMEISLSEAFDEIVKIF